MKTPIRILALVFGFSIGLQGWTQERPDPGQAPTFIPAPPPVSGEIEPFPSNADGDLAFVAFIFDPDGNRVIISLDSLSNREFVLQSSADLKSWQDTDQRITGNKSVITFYVPVPQAGGNRYFRVRKI